ncbi:tyrosine--tRNA ligase [Patescibacteria group bacterium]|nr:tyrosine--tRNA ligase [Patescibacteria group bacterium]
MKKLTTNEVLTRQVAEILPTKKGLAAVMKKRKIRLYLGIDPTGGNLHLGHAIALRKLQQFADLGHEAILLVGTGTVLAGDPSQRDTARPTLTKKEIEKNTRDWKKQAGKVIDFSKVKMRYNGDWLLRLKLSDILEIASNISAVQLFQRDMFQRRIKRGDTVWMHETLYPLLQGYDSVALNVDLEIGGTDQVFNMLIGRELERKMKNKEKFVLTVSMILGLDGRTMSKTSGNTVNIADPPKEMYGKLMTLRDELVSQYFELAADVSQKEITKLKKRLSPRDFKARLAKEIVALYHGVKKAQGAEKEFVRVFQKKQLPLRIQKAKISRQGPLPLYKATAELFSISGSEARRVIEQGGVKIDGMVQRDPSLVLKPRSGMIIQLGKRRTFQIM